VSLNMAMLPPRAEFTERDLAFSEAFEKSETIC